MDVGIIGATGRAGRAIYAEAVKRGHSTTAIVRDPDKARQVLGADVDVLHRDAFDLTATDVRRFDVVVDAFRPAEQPEENPELAARLVELLRKATTARLIVIVGAGSLATGKDGHLMIDELRQQPGAEAWIAEPESQLRELRFLQDVDDVDWVAVSPSAAFEPGEAAEPVLGHDELLVAPDGSSKITTGTMAVAILDEIEHRTHRQERFTVRDA